MSLSLRLSCEFCRIEQNEERVRNGPQKNLLLQKGNLKFTWKYRAAVAKIYLYLSVELLDSRLRREWENFISKSTEPIFFDTLKQFLDCWLHILESMLPAKIKNVTTKSSNAAAKSARSHVVHKQKAKAEKKEGAAPFVARITLSFIVMSMRKKQLEIGKSW